jgi:THO complex subunit 5
VSVVDKFKEKISEIKALQANADTQNNRGKLVIAYRQGLLLCASIKKLNRVANMRVNKVRNMTHEEKNKIDEHHLELQNLLYEISHLQVEINKCLEFRSCDEDISLVDLDTFYGMAPVEISRPVS